ncbi:suppressor of disruption of TFIIS-like [Chenopodium quinoa]|uniref:suppressor of disruption of TFIIS-like n=1 Tax=Chenopodium quinoa TaxID=63459 RepID=UPI000B78FAAC|nr:suppressor of disruption of TFIIS-like [Chenopodium quinoa]
MDAVVSYNGAKYDCLLFDLDDTLYPLSSGVNLACRKNIEDYMLKFLHMEESEVPLMCLELYREYGTTMAGLKALGYEFDNDEFHEYVHGSLPYETLKPDPVLRNLLLSTPQRKIVFTNSDKAHTARVLNKLGLGDCFEGIICFETLNHQDNNEPISKSHILCKPSVEAIEAAISIANLDPKRTIFFDDSARNIASGKAAGLHTVVVGRSDLVPGADYALRSIHNMKEALPEIWEAKSKEHHEQVLQAAAAETVVRA